MNEPVSALQPRIRLVTTRDNRVKITFRVGRGKYRPLIVPRPTLRKVRARLRILNRNIRAHLKNLKPGQVEPQIVATLRKARAQVFAYQRSLNQL